jgi:hypothetical protein
MKTSKKYHFQVSLDGATWRAEILRRVTAKTTVVTKQKSGFASEAEAQVWGQEEIRVLLKNSNAKELNKRRASKHD